MTIPNRETLEALEELRQKRDAAQAKYIAADRLAQQAWNDKTKAKGERDAAAEAYRKAADETFGLWETP